MRSSLALTRTLLRFHDTVGSGWPRGGTHSSTAGSPAATTMSLGACRKSSLRTEKKTQRNLISFRGPCVSNVFKRRTGNQTRRSASESTAIWLASSNEAPICLGGNFGCFLLSEPAFCWEFAETKSFFFFAEKVNYCVCMCMTAYIPSIVLVSLRLVLKPASYSDVSPVRTDK